MSDDKSPIGFIHLDPSEIEAAMCRKVERDSRIVRQREVITRLRAALATARREVKGGKSIETARQAREAKLKKVLRDLLRCTEKHVFGNEWKAQRDKARAALEGKKDE